MIAAALKHMFAAGMSNEAIIAAVEDMERSGLMIAPSSNAIRCARYRDRVKHVGTMSNRVKHVNDTAKEGVSHTLPEENIYNITPTKAKKRGSRLSDDWKPSSESQKYGEKMGFSAAEIWSMAEDFLLFFVSSSQPSAIKLNWETAFKGWMRRERARGSGTRPSSAPAYRGRNVVQGSFRKELPPEPKGPKITDEERQANLAKLATVRFKPRPNP